MPKKRSFFLQKTFFKKSTPTLNPDQLKLVILFAGYSFARRAYHVVRDGRRRQVTTSLFIAPRAMNFSEKQARDLG
jgi:hypothetical protein